MATNLKKLSEQVMVITGASSGIGRAWTSAAENTGALAADPESLMLLSD